MAAHLEKLGLLRFSGVRLLHSFLFCYTLFGTAGVAHDHAAVAFAPALVQGDEDTRAADPKQPTDNGSTADHCVAPHDSLACWHSRTTAEMSVRRGGAGCASGSDDNLLPRVAEQSSCSWGSTTVLPARARVDSGRGCCAALALPVEG